VLKQTVHAALKSKYEGSIEAEAAAATEDDEAASEGLSFQKLNRKAQN